MRYTGRLFFPAGAKLNLNLRHLSPIQGRTAYELYGRFKREMEFDEFDARIESPDEIEPVLLQFRRVGQTAGYAAFSRGSDDNSRQLEAVVAFLTRLDGEDDTDALRELREDPELAVIHDSDWEAAREDSIPLAAAFFTSEQSLNDPLIHGLMSLTGAAFFDRLGLLE